MEKSFLFGLDFIFWLSSVSGFIHTSINKRAGRYEA